MRLSPHVSEFTAGDTLWLLSFTFGCYLLLYRIPVKKKTPCLRQESSFCEEDYFVKTDEAQGNEIAWIVPNAQKNRMEPIRLTLQSGACTEVDSPHEGEEFGYVLSGRVLIHLGDECHKAKKGESFYYPASCNHYLENPGKTPAVILWISSPPYF